MAKIPIMAAPSSRKSRYHAPALEKGLDILELLAGSRLPLSQVELAQQLGRSQSEFFRMLTCLEDRGYIIREADSGRFKLTLRLYELGHKQHATSMLRSAARVPMERLAEETGQACHLSVQSGASALILMERMPSQRVCLAVGEGTAFPLVETTSGRLLLSHLGPGEITATLQADSAFTSKSPHQRKAIRTMIDALRSRDHVLAKSEVSEGVTDIALTVGVRGTDTLAVLVVPYLAIPQARKQRHRDYLAAVRACAYEINRNLGILA